MHEIGLVRDIVRRIEAVAAEHGARRVTRIRVRLGALSHLDPDHFREHFAEGARGTVAAGAHLEVTLATATDDPLAQEIVLEDIEVEGPEVET